MRVGGHGLEVESSAAGHLGSSENAGSDSVGLESESLRGCQVMQMLLACGPHCVQQSSRPGGLNLGCTEFSGELLNFPVPRLHSYLGRDRALPCWPGWFNHL